jgi:hypothetical protein
MRIAVLLCLALIAACSVPEHGPLMEPGVDCLKCHGNGDAPRWSAAGTVYADGQAKADQGIQGAQVIITDKNDRTLTLDTNGSGNFYTAETLVFPAKKVEVRHNGTSKIMGDFTTTEPLGSCNDCHDGTKYDRIHVP